MDLLESPVMTTVLLRTMLVRVDVSCFFPQEFSLTNQCFSFRSLDKPSLVCKVKADIVLRLYILEGVISCKSWENVK